MVDSRNTPISETNNGAYVREMFGELPSAIDYTMNPRIGQYRIDDFVNVCRSHDIEIPDNLTPDTFMDKVRTMFKKVDAVTELCVSYVSPKNLPDKDPFRKINKRLIVCNFFTDDPKTPTSISFRKPLPPHDDYYSSEDTHGEDYGDSDNHSSDDSN
jgi:hypothetical protein